MSPVARPDLRHERALLRQGSRVVAGMDEVGRGALAGPVSVGVVAVDLSTRTCPQGVADSKLLTPAARQRLLPALGRWGTARAVGHASAAEIDAIGIIAALRLAGGRALAQLGVPVDLVLLDGSHDWLSPPSQPTLFDVGPDGGASGGGVLDGGVLDGAGALDGGALDGAGALDGGALDEAGAFDAGPSTPTVRTKVKADRTCASVAAASVLAKCERDAMMVELSTAYPAYSWHENKGYGSAEHLEALRLIGPSAVHRRSWHLPLLEPAGAGGPLELTGSDPAGHDVEPRWSMMEP